MLEFIARGPYQNGADGLPCAGPVPRGPRWPARVESIASPRRPGTSSGICDPQDLVQRRAPAAVVLLTGWLRWLIAFPSATTCHGCSCVRPEWSYRLNADFEGPRRARVHWRRATIPSWSTQPDPGSYAEQMASTEPGRPAPPDRPRRAHPQEGQPPKHAHHHASKHNTPTSHPANPPHHPPPGPHARRGGSHPPPHSCVRGPSGSTTRTALWPKRVRPSRRPVCPEHSRIRSLHPEVGADRFRTQEPGLRAFQTHATGVSCCRRRRARGVSAERRGSSSPFRVGRIWGKWLTLPFFSQGGPILEFLARSALYCGPRS